MTRTNEIVVDNFAGGGVTIGVLLAIASVGMGICALCRYVERRQGKK